MNHSQMGNEGGKFREKSMPTDKGDYMPLRDYYAIPSPNRIFSSGGHSYLWGRVTFLRYVEADKNRWTSRISKVHYNSNILRNVRKTRKLPSSRTISTNKPFPY